MQHHAICYLDAAKAKSDLEEYYKTADPDVHVVESDEFGIGEARELTRKSSLLPVARPQQVFIVACKNVTHEAQNALLKLFEEPPATAQFYLIIEKRGLLLPTLQSRLHFVAESTSESVDESVFDEFWQASYAERIQLIGEATKRSDHGLLESIVTGAEAVAHRSGERGLLLTVGLIRDYFSRRGASKKLLLESLALALPRK